MVNPKDIQHLHYVVQRNWEGEDGHDDLDLFVSLEDKDELLKIVGDDPLVDVRFPGDGYYPEFLEGLLLASGRTHNDWKVPSLMAHFLTLYYHNEVHKKDDPYKAKLRELFLELFPPTKPDDDGVEFYV